MAVIERVYKTSAHTRAYLKEYRSRPDIKAKIKESNREYHSRPDVKMRHKEREREYRSRPEVRERRLIRERSRSATPEFKARRRMYLSKPEVKARVKKNNSRPEHKQYMRGWAVKTKYGISGEEYIMMVNERHGRCDICGNTPTELCVDHNHTTGKIRGLLCINCNMALGQFNDNIKLLESAVQYLHYSRGIKVVV